MGDTFGEGYSDALPVHTVHVSAFFMDRTEVTKAQWDALYQWAIGHGYSFDNAGSGKAANHPVHSIAWYDAVKWCNARSEREGRPWAYYTDQGLSQPYRTGRVSPSIRWDRGYSSSSGSDPRGPGSGSYRAIRGGGWNSLAWHCRAANRNDSFYPDYRFYYLGFRTVLPPGQP